MQDNEFKLDKRTRLEDLAELAGVSIATISRALNDSPKVSADTKKRIWQLARDNNYLFKPHMPAMLSGAAATIVIVIPKVPGRDANLSDAFYQELIAGVGEAARQSSCNVLISHMAPKSFEELRGVVETNRADGVIFLGQSFLHDRFNRLADMNGRFVVWGAELPGQKYCSVGSDNLRGGEKATNHLLRLGRERIAFLGDTDAPEVQQRFQGYLKAYRSRGITPKNEWVFAAQFDIETAEAAVYNLLSQPERCDGIFASSDLIAIGAMRALSRAGLNVPGDISVVGYDNIQIARYSSPALTTISQDMNKAGRLLVSKLMTSFDTRNMQSERLPTDLIVRESCGS